MNDIELTSSNEVFSVVVSLSPGFVYFPAERWAINLILNGVSLGLYGIGEETVFGLSVGAGIDSPNLGLSYYF